MIIGSSPRLAAGGLVLAAGLVLTGCGASGSSSHQAHSSSTPNAQDQRVAYAHCMRKHGVDMPDPTPGSNKFTIRNNGNRTTLKAAAKACRKYGGRAAQALSGRISGKSLDNEVKLARCLRQHGVHVADPQPGQPLKLPAGSLRSPQTRKALQACRFKGATNAGGNG